MWGSNMFWMTSSCVMSSPPPLRGGQDTVALSLVGVRPSLLLCFSLHTVCRLAMALTRSRGVLLLLLLGPETVAGSLGVPVLTIGIKRCTSQASRTPLVTSTGQIFGGQRAQII